MGCKLSRLAGSKDGYRSEQVPYLTLSWSVRLTYQASVGVQARLVVVPGAAGEEGLAIGMEIRQS